jgi:hypothetical protein
MNACQSLMRRVKTKVCIAADIGIVSEINFILFPNNAVILYKTFIFLFFCCISTVIIKLIFRQFLSPYVITLYAI